MRKFFIGLLLAATAASPALADKGGHGGGHGNHGGGKPHSDSHRGGKPHGGGNPPAFRDGGKHGGHAIAFARPAARGNDGHERKSEPHWLRPAPVRVVRLDGQQARKQWKREAKEERKLARALERHERFRPVDRFVRVERRAPTQVVRYGESPVVRYVQPRVVRYIAPAPVRYVPSSYAPVLYQESMRRYDPTSYYVPSGYWPGSYSPIEPAYRSDNAGVFGSGGNGLLGAFLPVLLQSVIGGDLGGLSGVGGLGGLNGLGGLGSLGGLTGFGAPEVLPLQEASYAPYAYGNNTDLASLLLPSLLGSGSLF